MAEWRRILIVSNSPAFPRAELEQRQLEITIAKRGDAAFDVLLKTPFDLVVVDFAQARVGVDFIRRVRNTSQLADILILVLAEWGTGEPTLALSAGADAFEPGIEKSIDHSRLITSIERLLGRQVAAAKLETL